VITVQSGPAPQHLLGEHLGRQQRADQIQIQNESNQAKSSSKKNGGAGAPRLSGVSNTACGRVQALG